MTLFITSRANANRHAVYAEERRPNAVIVAAGQGIVGLVGQFPWGPDDQIIKAPDPKTRLNTISPPGMSRTGSGYLSLIQKGFVDVHVRRVLGTAAAKATATLPNSTPATVVTLELKYKGTAGNAVTAIVANATDGDSNHFNLEVQVTGPSGTTSDILENLNYSGIGSDSTPSFENMLLLGKITKALSSRPVNGTYTFTGGADGTINSGRYIGTAGDGDFGLASFENDPDLRAVLVDDPGNTDRAAINTALQLHAQLMGERLAIVNGNSGLASSAAITAAAANRSTRVVYVDPWVYMRDDVDGTERLVPPAVWFASVMSQLSPSTSPAWKDPSVGEMLAGITRLEAGRGLAIGTQTKQGISTLIDEPGGGFRFEAAVTTVAPQDPARKNVARMRIGDYVALSVTQSLRRYGDAPNVPILQDEVVGAVDRFLDVLKLNKDRDPINRPHIVDYSLGSISGANTQAEIDAGDFTIPCDMKTSSGMERILFSVRYGENVTIQAA
jgi:hypothetical protein